MSRAVTETGVISHNTYFSETCQVVEILYVHTGQNRARVWGPSLPNTIQVENLINVLVIS